MLHKILLGLIILICASTVNALTFNDDFSSYGSNYFILSDTNALKVTSFDQDLNSITSKSTQSGGHSLNFLDRNSMYASVLVAQNAADSSRVIIRADCNCDIPDYNAAGILHMPFWLDANTAGSGISVYIRIGQSTSNYFEYRKTFAEETSWWLGRHDITWDLNAADAIAGSPSFNDVNMLWVIVNHGVAGTDYNWSINGIWVEKNINGFSNGNWEIAKPATNAQGMAIINPANQLVLNTIDRQSYGYHGRIFATQFDALDLTDQQLDLEMDVNVVDANWGVRLMYDYVDGDDFTACYIFYATPTSLRYGVEQWVNNVRDFNQVTAVSGYGINKNFRCVTSGATGDTVTLYIDDVAVVTDTFGEPRRDGRVSIESFAGSAQHGGKIRIDNVVFTSTQISSEGGSEGEENNTCGASGPNRFNFDLIPVVIAVIMLFAALDGWQKGNHTQMAAAVGLGVLCIVIITMVCI